ncbi:MAG: ATP-binding protein [Bacillota bacterium]
MTVTAKVNRHALVRYDKIYYSVPARLAGQVLTVKAYPLRVEVWHKGEKVAQHQRSYEQNHVEYRIEHYIPVLERKTRAVRDAAPVKRDVDKRIRAFGERLPDKDFVAVLKLAVDHGQAAVMSAIERAAGNEQYTYEAVRFQLLQDQNPTTHTPTIPVDPLLPTVKAVDLSQYDTLCKGAAPTMDERKSLIKIYAKELRLPSFARYEQIAREAEQNGFGYEEFLIRMMKTEIHSRQENQRKQRIRQAKFPSMKTLDTFEFSNLPDIDPALIWHLAECNFIDKQENIVFIGNPGTGKTHLSTGLALMACKKGYRVRFYTAAALVNDLLEAQEQKRLSRLERQLNKVQLLVLDELSYLTFSRPSAELYSFKSFRHVMSAAASSSPLTWSSLNGQRYSATPC